MSWRILNDDLLAMLYRIEERGSVTRGSLQSLAELLLAERWSVRAALLWLQFRRQVTRRGETYHLTSQGLARAEQLVRTHRLWEHYLVTEVGMDTDRIHEQAERFEHFTSRRLHARLSDATRDPAIDPHGSPIPLPAEAARDPRASDHAG
jgi:manganese/zinc/iron transport system permease protein